MKITKNFDSREFFCTDGTSYPVEWLETRLKPLCDVLEKIRAEFNKPIKVTSGYRTEAYNKKIGGVRNSQHCQGLACDFKVAGIHARKVAKKVREMYEKGLKIGGLGSYSTFTHIDLRHGNRLAVWTGK